ncbi:hypothetical protein LXT21_12360 [Myxococcus sp. K38C18041901]|uniref:hypothetical protein n=1 Tax=Myxococcus guangdongensis TaxID=2906760 RepID=UPI0020A76269|nr:hypothetical protein [Myxococcus guangdongensis]MCP3059570.1 hypothetical protein [Myxococcus guangdongensis]
MTQDIARPDTTPSNPRQDSEAVAALSPRARELARLVGRRADDAAVMAYVTGVGGTVPDSTSDAEDSAFVTSKAAGVDLLFTHRVLHESYPPIRKGAAACLPYLFAVWLKPGFPEPLPLGVSLDMSADAAQAVLGAPTGRRGLSPKGPPYWTRVLDAEAGLLLEVETKKVGLGVRLNLDMAQELTTKRTQAGLFLGWCARRGLLDAGRFAAHGVLLGRVRNQEAQGSVLYDAALSRGLWDRHLVDAPGLRRFAHGWFHNMGGSFIRDDLGKVFGMRQGPHGHDEPVLDDDAWAAVDRATPVLDARFAQWVTTA